MGAYLCPGCQRTSRWCVCPRGAEPCRPALDSPAVMNMSPAEQAHEIMLVTGDTHAAFEAYCAAREALLYARSVDAPEVVALRAELASAPTAEPPHSREQSRVASLGRQGNPSNLDRGSWAAPCAHANSPLCDGSCLGCPHARGRE